MKFLVIWSWTPEHAKEIIERVIKWKPQGNYKVLYPMSMMLGRHKAFSVAECDDIMELYKDVSPWTDLCTFDIIPIETGTDLVAKFRPT